jgi:hypothetical protein
MRKLYFTLVLLVSGTCSFAQFPAPYCGPITFEAAVEPITQVTFAGIDNSSPASDGSPEHENFTAISGSVTAGQSYPIAVEGNTAGDFVTLVALFADWNQDDDFNDQGETYQLGTIINSTGTDGIVLNGTVQVPGTAFGGSTRMRMVKIWDSGFLPNACNDSGAVYGQMEDYTLDVTAIPQCLSGDLFPTTAVSASDCDGGQTVISEQSFAGQYFNVTVSAGQTYVFRSSVPTDFFTVSTDNGVNAAFSGTSPFVWESTLTGTVQVYLHSDINCGVEDVARITTIACGTECLNGDLFPAQTFTPSVCDGTTANLITDAAEAGQYANVTVQAGGVYSFSSSVSTDYFTISENGATSIAAGTSPFIWQATTTGTVRVYLHTDALCGSSDMARSTSVTCELLEIPGCLSFTEPADGDTLYVSVGEYQSSFPQLVSGGPIAGFTVYIGSAPNEPFYSFDVPNPQPFTFGLDASDAGNVYYWWAVPYNAAGTSTCEPVVTSFTVLASPLGVEEQDAFQRSVYPNPVTDVLTLSDTRDAVRVEVVNALGQVVLSESITAAQHRIDLSALPGGSYMVRTVARNGTVRNAVVMKR